VVNVHSFTSSFRPLPHAWRSLAIGVVLAVFWLAGYELFWRSRGFTPTLTDNEALWCNARRSVAPDGVVIVGSSRMQTGLDPEVMSRALGGRAVTQLALAGSNPIPVLLDLAHDPSFHGVVVLEYMPRRLLTPDSASVNRALGFLATCSNPSLVAGVEASMGRALQQRFVFMLPDLQAISLVSYVAQKHSLPGGSHELVRADRFNPIHFAHPVTGAGEVWDAPLTEQELRARMAELRAAIDQIRARGGRVIVYRSPVTGPVLADEERRFPAATWLPRVAELLGAPAIDFQTVPRLREVQCPDGEHPDADDVPSITEAVAAELHLDISAARR
jgi:hypothetical protein